MADFEVALTTDAVGDTFCISLWDLATGMQLKVYKGGCCPPRCVCLLGKDYIMASQVNKPIIHVWNTAKESVQTRLICPGKVTSVTCSPDGTYCVAACGEKIYVWQVASGNLLVILSRHYQCISCLKFTDDGSHFLSSGEDNLVLVWKMARILSLASSATGAFESALSPYYTWSDHALPVTDIHCGCGGMRGHVITSSLDQTCKLYDLSSGELLCSFVFNVGVTAVTMDTSEQSLFAGCTNGHIYQVELSRRGMKNNIHMEKEESLIFTGPSKQVNSVAVSMDGSLLLSGSEDQTARVWHVYSRQCLRVLNHRGGVTNACIVLRPLYLDSAPTKSSLSPIQPFKRHMHVPVQSRDRQLTGLSSPTDGGDSHADGIPMVLRGNLLAEGNNLENLEDKREVMVRQILNDVSKFDGRDAGLEEKRKLSRTELEEELESVGRVNRKFYRFAVDELMKEVYEVTEKDGT
ncbi:unnamed protein product [Porites evermanni]|uniref:WD repeat-containing protein 18 n=1 Tax=Porites evermanni TaxID=104178 RepID=A0ABN8MEF1_9CNID|nr:unnamed protein product [Porites evermanni]